ncbi:hypothetical protein D3C72_2524360 [compost metagenome]
MATEAGILLSLRRRMKGIRNEPQIFTNAQTTTTTMPGRMTGRATSKKACTGEAPATMALSS